MKTIVALAAVILFVVALIWFLNTHRVHAAPAPHAMTLDAAITHRALDPAILSATAGAQIDLTITSDEDGYIHVEGYEVAGPLSSTTPAHLQFNAEKAGSYDIHMHPASDPEAEIELGTLVVH